MRGFFVFIFLTFFALQAQAQKHELGIFLGGANGITDIGRTDFINPLPKDYRPGEPAIPLVIGGIYRFNLNPQQSLRLNLDYARIIDNDRLAAEDYRYHRGAKYSQSIFEGSIVFEYNFFPINADQERGHSPYIFAGAGAFMYNHPQYKVAHQLREGSTAPSSPTDFETILEKSNKKNFSYTMPFGAGYKYKFNWQWIVAAEIGVRPTLIDDLDMAFAKPEDFSYTIKDGLDGFPGVAQEIQKRNDRLIVERQIGDHSNNDWYVFTGLTLTYTFGRPACFCD
ncbi:MAG: DUF6089 family protein [Flavobacteriaceae bacterium]|nr:DUF6089 family protein [Flavobacteriaceae bacterium]